MIETLLALGCIFAVTATFVFAVRPALHHRRYQQTLANIARLEIDLGYVVTPEQENELSRQIMEAQFYAGNDGADGPPVPASKRVFGRCEQCGMRVALNAGRCRPEGPDCAKRKYRDSRALT